MSQPRDFDDVPQNITRRQGLSTLGAAGNADVPARLQAGCLPVRQRHLTQRIYDALRTLDTISSADVATQVMRDKGPAPDADRVPRTDFVRRVGLQLTAMQPDGKTERIGKGSALQWRLKPR